MRRQRGTEQHHSKDPSIPRSERSPQRDLAGEGSTRHQDCRGHGDLALGVSINPKRTGLSQRTRFVRSDTTAKQSRSIAAVGSRETSQKKNSTMRRSRQEIAKFQNQMDWTASYPVLFVQLAPSADNPDTNARAHTVSVPSLNDTSVTIKSGETEWVLIHSLWCATQAPEELRL